MSVPLQLRAVRSINPTVAAPGRTAVLNVLSLIGLRVPVLTPGVVDVDVDVDVDIDVVL